METKQQDVILPLSSIAENGKFSGYTSVFDVRDRHGDIVEKGAFTRTLRELRAGMHDIKFLWQHHMDEPIGLIGQIYEDDKGLFVEGELLLEVQRAREAYELLKSEVVTGLSIGYSVEGFDIDMTTGARVLQDLDLWEISLVTFPSNTQAQVSMVKQERPATIRQFEHFLRDAGYTRGQAKSIALHGFATDSREVGGEIKHAERSLIAALQRAEHILAR